MITDLLSRLEASQPLTEEKAWALYKIVALSEAVGWTLLLLGISIRHFKLPGSTIAVPITGQIHGTIFLIYFGVLIVIYSSLCWSRKKFLLAILAGIPPYGTLVFEQWEVRKRQRKNRHAFILSSVLASIAFTIQ